MSRQAGAFCRGLIENIGTLATYIGRFRPNILPRIPRRFPVEHITRALWPVRPSRISTADGRVLKWTPGSGSFQPFNKTTGRIAALTINRTAGVLGFGTSNGSFVQVPLDTPSIANVVSPGGPVTTGTVYDSQANRFIVVTDNGILSGYPSMR